MWDELWLKAALLHYGHLLGSPTTPTLWYQETKDRRFLGASIPHSEQNH